MAPNYASFDTMEAATESELSSPNGKTDGVV
jgi:hypothetical protein